jgi:nucleoside-diphosphate-sugar epimerase
MRGKVLVAGASGLVGHAAIEHFSRLGWEVVGVSRRSPADLPKAELVSVDLLDRDACAATFGAIGGRHARGLRGGERASWPLGRLDR